MKENLALLLAVLYLIYRFKTYKKTNKHLTDIVNCDNFLLKYVF